MTKVCVGVNVHAEPLRLRATLASLRANTAAGVELLLLPDGPDAETSAALSTLISIPQSGTFEPSGAAACFNRLATSPEGLDADVLVLLESGSLVSPRWLDFLLAALEANGQHGLAGPSTNHSWNEQGAFPSAGGGSPSEVARAARTAARRFGGEVRHLSPLYSLADFCYAVRREVVEAVGAADEGYGAGPCWEMDYNVRAERAGFRGVWACSAYVWRAPFTARRSADELRLFEANKRRYQDKFCGARLRGQKDDYRQHCRGDACPNFAPPALVQLNPQGISRAPLSAKSFETAGSKQTHSLTREELHADAEPLVVGTHTSSTETRVEFVTAEAPLVTCIMPTADRRMFVPQAVRCFLRQDYPNAELLILDDGVEPSDDCVPSSERVRYVRLGQKLSVGAKRNLACERAGGSIIVHWDDDDWYPTRRVSAQVKALAESGADICGTSRLFYYEASSGRAWRYEYGGGRLPWVAGNTLAYRRGFWERHRFPDVRVGEDTRFVWGATSARVRDLSDPSLCVATVHAANTSPKATDGCYWLPHRIEEVRALLGDDLHFYRTASLSLSGSHEWPLVTCIMPTADRRAFIPLALENFRRQDYPNKELVIVDDGDDAIGDLTLGQTGVRYMRLAMRTSIGGKRNLACRQPRGQIIAHWDDDDWYAPDRLRYQVAPIMAGEADLTGLVSEYVLELPCGDFWTTLPQLHRRMFVGDVHGGTLVYRGALLESGIRYPETNLAEDAALIRQAASRHQRLLRLSNPGVFVYVRHGSNAWREYAPGTFLDPAGWRRIARPATFSADSLDDYKAASSGRYASVRI
ncbi:MAG: glycosyltransferase [Pyrinomonadaceae bacterium]